MDKYAEIGLLFDECHEISNQVCGNMLSPGSLAARIVQQFKIDLETLKLFLQNEIEKEKSLLEEKKNIA